jgi:hypothetical protein
MAIVKMRVPRKPYDVDEIETLFVHKTERGHGMSETHPQFGSADPGRYQEMRDFYGIEEAIGAADGHEVEDRPSGMDIVLERYR